jgi:hypothetical protein
MGIAEQTATCFQVRTSKNLRLLHLTEPLQLCSSSSDRPQTVVEKERV